MKEHKEGAAELIELGRNFPPPSPLVQDALRDSFFYLSRVNAADRVRFPRFSGSIKDREAGASWLARRFDLKLDPDRIVIANGTQSVLVMLMAHYLEPGGVLLTEALTYPAIKPLSQLLHVTLQGVPLDADGIEPGSLEQACLQHKGKARVLYCMPTLHNPTSATMSKSRRQEIASIARRHNLVIIEDDIYGVLREDAPPPLSANAPERSWYILGLSKSLSCQLRVAYVVGPSPSMTQKAFWPGVKTTNWMVAPLIAEIATRWLTTHLASDILESVRVETKVRRTIANKFLGKPVPIHESSYHLWIEVPRDTTLAAFVVALRQRGVAVSPGDSFAVGSVLGDTRIRIGLGAAADHSLLRTGLSIIRQALERT
ncbi:aminotransferase-like domain-containing protein [Bradyrhizobium sp. DOA9]|uniref:aminotransferase-like domain-containing protein n=1 Tax=Bradyrhizobium sp. DOA9 TaxID=1126627 RepID=UPI0004999328|nr:PLP-dependent aminotransferase family protein [Bradyrhizobium sp. DOA9]GAJ37532.1 putative HTH-type transcriptional regulator in rdxA 3'region [Bradyrhizobium sp. DOA9]